MNVMEYVTAPARQEDAVETVHLVSNGFAAKTLCGKPVDEHWKIGDETVSGIAATCGNCRRVVGRRLT